MYVKEIWRYPVKSMAGEALDTADITELGINGDRIIQVRNVGGRILTARTSPGLLRHRAVLAENGDVLVNGRPWNTEQVAGEVAEAAGPGTRLVRSDAEDRFDILPLLVTTDGMFAAVGYDRRRFRPNLVIGGVEGLSERQWEGAQLRIGEVVIGMDDLRGRCIMTTFDPDTGKQDLSVLRRVQKQFDGVLGLNSYVVKSRPYLCQRPGRTDPPAMSRFDSAVFLGVDLGWYGKPSGLASIAIGREGLTLRNVTRLEETDDILRWIKSEAGGGSAVVGVDAPLVIRNRTGIRDAERELNREFRRFHAGCHAANLGRPFAERVVTFSRRLEALGFGHGAEITARQQGRFQIEVHPHAAMVNLFDLPRIVKYKRGRRAERAKELRRLRRLMLSRLPLLDPALPLLLPPVPNAGNLKPVEDQIDAVLCAYIAAHWWLWAKQKNHIYGCRKTGYIVVPERTAS